MFFRLLVFLLFGGSISAQSQCLTGTLQVSGPGCGCIANCDLSSYGGPDCGNSGVLGNCAAGHLPMSISFNLPVGCTVNVTAEMRPRSGGCTASGADGNSATNDRLKVEGSVMKPWQIGGSNASLSDGVTQNGGIITVLGAANRADEIITYSLTEISGSCPFCLFLPVSWERIDAFLEGEYLWIEWRTGSEPENSRFEIELADQSAQFAPFHAVAAMGDEFQGAEYSSQLRIPSSFIEVVYIRIRQIDHNGQSSYSPVIALPLPQSEKARAWLNATGKLEVYLPDLSEHLLQVYDLSGRLIRETAIQGGRSTPDINPGDASIVIVRITDINGKLVFSDLLGH